MVDKLKRWWAEGTTKAGVAALLSAVGAWIATGSLNVAPFPGSPNARDLGISAFFLLVLKGRRLTGGGDDTRKEPGPA